MLTFFIYLVVPSNDQAKRIIGDLHTFCIGKKSRNYPDPTRCDGFISCNGHIAIRVNCPAGLWYNFKKDQCDSSVNVDCKGMYSLLGFFKSHVPI